jgi:hypothetical protein
MRMRIGTRVAPPQIGVFSFFTGVETGLGVSVTSAIIFMFDVGGRRVVTILGVGLIGTISVAVAIGVSVNQGKP